MALYPHAPDREHERGMWACRRECAGTGVAGMARLWATGTKAAITHVGAWLRKESSVKV